MNERDALMRAAALCRGVSGRLHTDLMECKPGSTTARTLADMESGALHCIRKIEDAILALPETPRPEVAGSEWISVKDRVPADGADVLVTPGWATDSDVSIESYCAEYNCFLMEIEDGKRVTHWMPLPQTPRSPLATITKEK